MSLDDMSPVRPQNSSSMDISSVRAQHTAQLAFALILALSVLLNVTGFTRGHSWGDDFAAYIAQAGAVAGGTIPEAN